MNKNENIDTNSKKIKLLIPKILKKIVWIMTAPSGKTLKFISEDVVL